MTLFGLDYVTGPPVADLKAAGVSFVCRYLSAVNAQTQIKLLTKAEAEALSAAGIDIVSNYEWYGTRALEGGPAGGIDANTAKQQHADCGGPADRPVYFSVDFEAQDSQLVTVGNYFKAVANVLGLERTGAYGSYAVLKYLFDEKLITWGWQTYAWSNGMWEGRAHLQQFSNGHDLVGHSVDYNRAMTEDFGQWRIGEEMPSPLSIHDPAVAELFEDVTTDPQHPAWKSKATGYVLHDALLKDYIANGAVSLERLRDLKSNEIYGTNGDVIQYHELGIRMYSHATGKVESVNLFNPPGSQLPRLLSPGQATPAPQAPQAQAQLLQFAEELAAAVGKKLV